MPKLKGPFTLEVEYGYATVYDGNKIAISVLSELELGWHNEIEKCEVTEDFEEEQLREIVNLMNAGWTVQQKAKIQG